MAFNKKKLANKIYGLRKSMGLSQEQFANVIKINIDVVKLLEIGEFNENLKDIVNTVCTHTDTNKKYFDSTYEKQITRNKKVVRKKKVEIIKPILTNNNMRKIVEDKADSISAKDIISIEPTSCSFYENELLTYQLKNSHKTRICAYCGKETHKSIKKTKYTNICYYILKCDCKDFIQKCNTKSEAQRYKKVINLNKIYTLFDDFFKEQCFDIKYYDLLKTYFELKVMLNVFLGKY